MSHSPGSALEPEPGAEPEQVFRLAATLYLVLALAGLAWIGLRSGQIPVELFLDPQSWGLDLALGLGTAGGLLGSWEATRRLSARARELEQQLAEILGPLRREEVLGLALLSGVAEEVFFRGAVQPSWGYVAATLLFGLLHTGRGRPFMLWTVSALVAGAALGGLMLWRENLLAPIVAHATINAVQLQRLTERR